MSKHSTDKDTGHLVCGNMLTGKQEITLNRSSALFFDYFLTMETASCSKTSRTIYQIILGHIPSNCPSITVLFCSDDPLSELFQVSEDKSY